MLESMLTLPIGFAEHALGGGIIALIALTVMEIVLGIDNIVFISIITGKLPKDQQARARHVGLALALVTRIMFLFSITWIMGLKDPVVELSSLVPVESIAEEVRELHEVNEVSWRDIILFAGGLFLLAKSVYEIHSQVEGKEHGETGAVKSKARFATVIIQILLLDIVFSIDSVITAVGMVPASQIHIMIAAVVLSMIVMVLFANPVGNFVERNPTIKVLALSFLLMIGVMLIAEGLGTEFNKGYIYFAMAFSLIVELLNIRARRKRNANVVPH